MATSKAKFISMSSKKVKLISSKSPWVTAEKLQWINDNLRRNDKRDILNALQKSNPKITYDQVTNVLYGRFYGTHGKKIISAAEKLIKVREREAELQKQEFTPKN